MRQVTVVLLVLCVVPLRANEYDRVAGLAELIHEFALREAPDDWNGFVKDAAEARSRWQAEHKDGGDGSYLDQRVREFLLSPAALADSARMKLLVRWLALYAEFKEPLPTFIQKPASDIWPQVEILRQAGVTWESLLPLARQRTAYVANIAPQPAPTVLLTHETPVDLPIIQMTVTKRSH